MAKTLSEIKSDIYFLTETHERLTPQKDFQAIFSGTPDRKHLEGERWTSIWSRWPITSLNDFVSDKSRCVAGEIENTPFGQLIVYGTVLPWNGDRRTPNNGNHIAFGDALEALKDDIARIKDVYPKSIIVLAGDFNQSLVENHYYGSKLKRSKLEHTLKEIELAPLTSLENDPIYRDAKPMACIDHICVSTDKEWEVLETFKWPNKKSLKREDSDHYGVKVEIKKFSI